MDDETLGKLLAEVHRDYADYRRPEGVSVSPSSMPVMVDSNGETCGKESLRTGKPVSETCTVLKISFLKSLKLKEWSIERGNFWKKSLGIAEERESSSAQIRTLLNEQRKTIIAEYCEKVSHHELQAAHAKEERRILQEELWRQQQDFREVHQQKSYWDGGITKIPEFYLRYDRETEAHRGIRTLL